MNIGYLSFWSDVSILTSIIPRRPQLEHCLKIYIHWSTNKHKPIKRLTFMWRQCHFHQMLVRERNFLSIALGICTEWLSPNARSLDAANDAWRIISEGLFKLAVLRFVAPTPQQKVVARPQDTRRPQNVKRQHVLLDTSFKKNTSCVTK